VSIGTLLLIRAKLQGPPSTTERRLLRQVTEGLSCLWRTPFLRAAVGMTAAVSLLLPAVTLTLIVLARYRGASPADVGIVIGTSGAGGLLGALVAPRLVRRLRAGTVLIAGAWVWAAVCPLLTLVSSPLALGPIAAVLAFVIPLWNVTLQARGIPLIPPHLLARVFSVALLLGAAAAPLGSLLAGALLSRIGPAATVLALAAGMLAVALAATASPTFRTTA
jgi:predicted MFS family arabinose efflux permease